MAEWIEVAQTSEIQPGESKVVKVLNESVAVFNANGQFYAIDNTCPHQGGPLGEGDLEGEVVTCPWHEWQYNVRTGCPIVTPAVKTYDVRMDGEIMQIAVDPEARERYRRNDSAFKANGEAHPIYEILEQINRTAAEKCTVQ